VHDLLLPSRCTPLKRPIQNYFALYSMAMEQIVVVMPCLQISSAIQ
jgi:hypothetical protein